MGCTELDVLDYKVIEKMRKKPSSEAVLEEEVGFLKEAPERWLHPGQNYFLNVARGTQQRARRVPLLLKRHFDAIVELENALNGGLEEGGEEEENVTGPDMLSPIPTKGVAHSAGGLADNITPFPTALASVSNNVQLLDNAAIERHSNIFN
jgi:hypothetical protein